MEINVYLLGRTKKKLCNSVTKSELEDCAFINERIDEKIISACSFKHCTFANISFKEARISNSTFLNCVFLGCYFRKSDFSEVTFIGCRFIDCLFPKIITKCCKFDYSSFNNCFIPFNEIKNSLPHVPNLREELSRNLSVESAKLGFFDESNQYRRDELRAKEKNLLAAFKGETEWYRNHYDCCRKFTALFQYIISRLNGFFFGYGQYFYPLVRSFFISIFFFWMLFFFLRENLINTITNKHPSGWDVLLYSFHNIVPVDIDIKIEAINNSTRLLAGIEALCGGILAAYVASFIFRWSQNK